MLEKKLHIWSLFRGRCWWGLLLSQPQTRRVGVGKHEVIKVLKVDFFALLYIVKKERIMYIEILFWIKNMSITTRTFARITKKILWKAEQNCLHQKGTEFLLSYPFQKRPSVALLFCQQLVVCQVTFRKRRPLPSSVKAWLGLSGPLTCLYGQVCASWPRPPRPNQSQHVLSLYSEECMSKEIHMPLKKNITTQ